MLDECAIAHRDAHQLREAFYEELGDSAMQKLINMEQAHGELQGKLLATQELLEAQRRATTALEYKLEEADLALCRAESAQTEAQSEQAQLEKEVEEMAKRNGDLESQLSALSAPKEQIERLEKRCKELEAFAEEADEARKKALAESDRRRIEINELEWKVKQFAAYEQAHIDAKRSARRKQRGNRKEAVRLAPGKEALPRRG